MTHASRTDGFTVVELAIAGIVIAVVSAIAIPSFFGAKDDAFRKDAVGVAMVYEQAVTAFKLERSQRVPVMGSADWPGGGWNGGRRGPLGLGSTAAAPRYYVAEVPATVSATPASSTFVIGPDDPASAPTTAKGAIRYVVGPPVAAGAPPSTHRFEVWVRNPSTSTLELACTIGDLPDGSGAPHCAQGSG